MKLTYSYLLSLVMWQVLSSQFRRLFVTYTERCQYGRTGLVWKLVRRDDDERHVSSGAGCSRSCSVLLAGG